MAGLKATWLADGQTPGCKCSCQGSLLWLGADLPSTTSGGAGWSLGPCCLAFRPNCHRKHPQFTSHDNILLSNIDMSILVYWPGSFGLLPPAFAKHYNFRTPCRRWCYVDPTVFSAHC
jgi:hypothetical protein